MLRSNPLPFQALSALVLVGGIGSLAANAAGATGAPSSVATPNFASSEFDPSAIYLAAATLHPDPASSLLHQPGRINADERYLMQLHGPLSAGQRSALSQAGFRLGDYLPLNTYLVSFAGPPVEGRFASLDFIRWIGRFEEAWKIHPTIGRAGYETEVRQQLSDSGRVALTVTLFPETDIDAARARVLALEGAVVHAVERIGTHDVLRMTMPLGDVDMLAAIASVQFVEETEEVRLWNSSTRWIVQSNIPVATPLHDHGLTGAGQIVGILDTGVNLNHCSFFDTNPVGPTHRKAQAINGWPGYSPGSENPSLHGTHVACTVLGDAGVDDDTRGIAYGARFVLNTTPQHDGPGIIGRLEHHSSQGAILHTNSWGDTSVDYGSLTRGVDVFGYDHEDQLIVFACGNDAVGTNPKNAKNCISVGATMDAPSQHSYCIGGTGPTVDGRRKPEVYAPGCNTHSASMTTCLTQQLTGTSMAAPVVAGVAVLGRQYFLDGYHPTGRPNPADAMLPTAALLKAMLTNTSVDMTGITGYPSNLEGWGRLLADDAFYFHGDRRRLAVLADVRNALGLSTNDVVEFPLIVAGSDEKLKITLAFCDPPGAVGIGNGPAWVNDLDLEVVAPGGALYRGNVFSGGVSAPGGVADDRNNVEQVHVPSPAVGLWTIRVRAKAVNVGTQGYSLLATGVVAADSAAIAIDLPDGPPTMVPAGGAVQFAVNIIEGTDTLAPGSPMIHYRYDQGSFISSPLTLVSGKQYLATLPAGDCDQTAEFFLTAGSALGATVASPVSAPALTYSATVGTFTTVFHDDFETDLGWTVQNENLVGGAWVRGIPSGNGVVGDPTSDYDNSGRCYVTGNGNFHDVNGGPTRLISPAFDLASSTDPQLSYARWFRDSAGGDTLVVELSSDNGQSWTLVEAVGAYQGWQLVTVAVRDFVTPTAVVRLRFSTQDLPNNSFTEAAVDAVRLTDFSCVPACTPGDVNNDGLINGRDIDRFLAILLGATPTARELCAADVGATPDGMVTLGDVDEFVSLLLGGGS